LTTSRTFIAVDFPTQVIEKINGLQKTLYGSALSAIRWIKPENIHMTLKFLGEVELAKIQIIENYLNIIANEIQPFHINLDGIGAFPNWGHPRIIWISIEKSEPLLLLAKMIEENMRNLGFQKEIRPFSPHLTIGRIRDNVFLEDLQILEIKCRTLSRIENHIRITNIQLYKSDLYPLGPVYTLLHSSAFKAII
jgi:2'-5' RNA ligase